MRSLGEKFCSVDRCINQVYAVRGGQRALFKSRLFVDWPNRWNGSALNRCNLSAKSSAASINILSRSLYVVRRDASVFKSRLFRVFSGRPSKKSADSCRFRSHKHGEEVRFNDIHCLPSIAETCRVYSSATQNFSLVSFIGRLHPTHGFVS